MTSTGTFQGFGGDSRKSSKVLKPPGGGSSDIFGAPPEEMSPRRVKNHNHSQLGSALFSDEGPKNDGSMSAGTTSPDSPRFNKPGNDSYNRLFGPPDAPSIQNAKNHARSNISLSGDSLDSCNEKIVSSNGRHLGSNGTAPINGNAITNDIADGNPVTGVGYTSDIQNNVTIMKNGTSASSTNGSEKSSDTSPAGSTKGQQSRNRVPPGGYSSGLW